MKSRKYVFNFHLDAVGAWRHRRCVPRRRRLAPRDLKLGGVLGPHRRRRGRGTEETTLKIFPIDSHNSTLEVIICYFRRKLFVVWVYILPNFWV